MAYNSCGVCYGETCVVKCQGFCEVGCQAASEHGSDPGIPTIGKNDIIIKKLPKSKVQAIMNYLAEAIGDGSKRDSGDETVPTVNSSDFLHASDINKILYQLTQLNGCNPGDNFSRDQIIYGYQMNAIMDLIRNAQVDDKAHGGACDKCNTTCDSCISCNNCG